MSLFSPFVSGFSHLRWQKSLSYGRQRKRHRPSYSSLISVRNTCIKILPHIKGRWHWEQWVSFYCLTHDLSHLALVTFADSAMSERVDSHSCQLAKHFQSSSHASLLSYWRCASLSRFVMVMVYSRIWMAWNCRRKERKWRTRLTFHPLSPPFSSSKEGWSLQSMKRWETRVSWTFNDLRLCLFSLPLFNCILGNRIQHSPNTFLISFSTDDPTVVDTNMDLVHS